MGGVKLNTPITLTSKVPFTKNFTWAEVLYLPVWEVHAFPNMAQADNLTRITAKLQIIRDDLKLPIKITSGLRPHKYNKLIGGARRSQHIFGRALDFQVQGYEDGKGCDTIRAHLLLSLKPLNIRMENLPGSNWVHIDMLEYSGDRFFRP